MHDFSRRRPYNAVSDFVDSHIAHGRAGKVAFIDPDRSLTYGELLARSVRFANALRALGIRHEERVALLLHDTVDYPVAFWGTIRAGSVALPLNTFLTVSQYAYMLSDSRAAALVASTPLVESIRPALEKLPHLKTIILVDAGDDKPDFPGRDVYRFEDVIAQASGETFTAETLSDDVAFWMYTSGSTGDPKGVKHVHTSLMATAKLFGQGVVGIHEGDVVHSAAKLFFAYGLGNAMTFPLSVGATAVLWPQRPTPDGVLEVMRKHCPTIFYGVPSLYTALLAHSGIAKGMGSDRLRVCVSAGEALPAHVGERWRDVVGVDVLDGIGSTEMLQTFLSNRPGDIRYGSTGKPVPGYETRIVDDKGHELAAGEVGELIVRGPSAAEGYWNQRAKSRRTFAGEWTYTGDKFRRDADGYYYYCGRTDDMFKVSGMWVSPFDVEAALISHEAVLEAAVIGKEDADGLVKPKAFIVLKNGYVADDSLLEKLRLHVKETAGAWKYPRWIELREGLPRTATGKIQRFKLRDEDTRTPPDD
ncbi:MAG TPA: benzoate-CoA ligase family protein [Pseudolabrys sp.]|nr:benzoate-CoA ligase family protein [Pseudolabrys sp.]